MLRELRISNFALIGDTSIRFTSGLNVISGETGAGKSLLLAALDLILGGRPKDHYIRSGSDSLEVEALFDLTDLPQSIKEDLPAIIEGPEVLLTRTFSRSGKGRILINGRLGTVSLLADVGPRLLSICSQKDHLKLLDSSRHRHLLDVFAGSSELALEFVDSYRDWIKGRKALRDWEEKQRNADRRRLELTATIDLLSPLGLKPGLRESLEGEILRFAGAEKVTAVGKRIVEALFADGGAMEMVKSAIVESQIIEKIDPGFAEAIEHLKTAREELDSFEGKFERFISSCQLDPAKLEELRERLSKLASAERRFKADAAGLELLLQNTSTELASLDNDEGFQELSTAVTKAEERVRKLGNVLTQERKKASKALKDLVEKELSDVNMKECKFESRFTTLSEPIEGGFEKIEFFIAANKGSELKPLKEVASGGELSRILLILKKIIADTADTPVLIFDEVDSGISGSVARAVGLKLRELSGKAQIVAVTHLPQVASLGDHHLLVHKDSDVGVTTVRELNGEQRIDEVARMLSGFEVTAAARRSAEELLSR